MKCSNHIPFLKNLKSELRLFVWRSSLKGFSSRPQSLHVRIVLVNVKCKRQTSIYVSRKSFYTNNMNNSRLVILFLTAKIVRSKVSCLPAPIWSHFQLVTYLLSQSKPSFEYLHAKLPTWLFWTFLLAKLILQKKHNLKKF